MMDQEAGRQHLQELRTKIDAVDDKLLDVLAERYVITRQVGVVKRDAGLPPADPSREQAMYERLRTKAEERGLDPDVVVDLYRTLLAHVVVEHQAIAAQGSETNF